MKMDASAFQDTTLEWSATPLRPVRASRATRAVYCLALLAFALPALAQGASWLAPATGEAINAALATWVLFVISAAMAWRVYGVVSYPDALDARPPHLLGWLMRWAGWLIMAGGVAGLLALMLTKPLALLLSKGNLDSAADHPAVAFWATVLAASGWLGCVLFEISRWTGYRVSAPGAGGTRSQRIRDSVAL